MGAIAQFAKQTRTKQSLSLQAAKLVLQTHSLPTAQQTRAVACAIRDLQGLTGVIAQFAKQTRTKASLDLQAAQLVQPTHSLPAAP